MAPRDRPDSGRSGEPDSNPSERLERNRSGESNPDPSERRDPDPSERRDSNSSGRPDSVDGPDREPPITRRVHVAPLGFEDARIREPIREWRADGVVAIVHEDGAEVPYLERLLADLEADDRIALELRTCDIFDLYDAMGTIAAAIDDHDDDEVFVNVSAGSKITAVAGTIACMATGATPIYARPDYGSDDRRVPDEPLHEDVAETFALPTYPIDRPSALHLAFMRYVAERTDSVDGEDPVRTHDGEQPADPADRIDAAGQIDPADRIDMPESVDATESIDATESVDKAGATGRYRGPNKRELIAFGRASGFDPFARTDAEGEKAYYRVLDAHVLEPLADRGYVTVERVGRKKYVTLTAAGRNALRAFGHLAASA